MHGHGKNLLFCSQIWLPAVHLISCIVLFHSSFCKRSDVNSWMTNPIEADKMLGVSEIIFPVQYNDYHHQCEKWNFVKGFPERQVYKDREYYTITYQGVKYWIDLIRDETILHQNYSITASTNMQKPPIYMPKKTEKCYCFYHGFVRGLKRSEVLVSICNGLSGTIVIRNVMLVIQPNGNGSHAIYPQEYGKYRRSVSHRKIILPQAIKLLQSPKKKFVELLMIVDQKFYETYLSNTSNRVMELVDIVDGFCAPVGIRVILSHLEIWNDGDRINTSRNAVDVVLDLIEYRQNLTVTNYSLSSPWIYADLVQLIHGGDFSGESTGDWHELMCHGITASVVQNDENAMITAAMLTRQIGHHFGLKLDNDDPNCTCDTVECIMNNNLSYKFPLGWSSCSKDQLYNLSLDLTICLTSPYSPRMYGFSKCGNGIVEENEECDCGSPELCTRKCCNSTNCKLTEGSACDNEACCDNCQISFQTKKCREIANHCDLPEYCDGVSPHCPVDLYKEDGLSCTVDSKQVLNGNPTGATCSQGMCLTIDGQCQLLWSEVSEKSNQNFCHIKNTEGTVYGNCGAKEDGSFTKCAEEDVLCGKLFCAYAVHQEPSSAALKLYKFNELPVALSDALCVSMLPVVEFYGFDYAFNGSLCGDGKVCVDRKCRPPTLCTPSCHGNGVCDNLGNCHCNDGWEPPNCSSRKSNLLDEKSFYLGILFGVCCICIIALLTIFISWFERMCRKRQSIVVGQQKTSRVIYL